MFNEYLDPMLFNPAFWKDTFDEIISNLQNTTYNEQNAYNILTGVQKKLTKPREQNQKGIQDMFIYLDELDRRRGTSWRNVFPYLEEFA